MTTVPKRAAGRCPGCGQTFQQPATGRPRSYCSDACKKRFRRAMAAKGTPITATTTAGRGETAEEFRDRRLGTSVETATRAGQTGCGATDGGKKGRAPSATRDGRFERRDAHQGVSLGKTFKGCGRRLIAGAATVTGGPGGAAFRGVMTCGMVHMCAWCAARILAARAAYAQDGAEAWVAAGGGVVMSAHTLRHYRKMKFGTLRKRERGGLVAVLHDAWSKAYGHRSGKMWQQAKAVHGVIGVLRSFEDTWGEETGFHLHFHAMWFTERPLSEDEVKALRETLSDRWGKAVVASGGYPVSKAYGVRVDRVDLTEAGAVGRYLFKDGDQARIEPLDGVGAEMAFGSDKLGRKAGRLGPFQLGDLAATGDAVAVKAWQEREYGVYGVRKMYLSNGMRGRLAALGVVDDRTDAEIAADDGEGREPLALIPRDTWYQHVLPVKGRRLELIHAAERGGVEWVRTLIESWGLVWGRHVLPALEPNGES